MTRSSSLSIGGTGLLLGMLVAFALAFASMANAIDAVDHAEGERHTHVGLTTATSDDHGGSDQPTDVGGTSDAGATKSGQAHHHHLDPGAGIAVGMAVVVPAERERDRRYRSTEARLADAKIEGLQRPPRAEFAIA